MRRVGATSATRSATLARRWIAVGLLLVGALAAAQEPTDPDPTEVLNALLSSLLGFDDLTGRELQQEVAKVGGVPFRHDVPLDYMKRDQLAGYLKELLDSEYPPERARADERTLMAFGLLQPGTDLRALRGKLLLDNVAGFYDERPGHKRLYAVSRDRSLTPANQLILSHELRHALQDQYVDVHGLLPDSVGDFDDRRMAFLSLLEGDATLVMERFLLERLGGGKEGGLDLGGFTLPAVPSVPGAPPVLRDQLVLPYLAGLDFAQAVWARGGWEALREAWTRPPRSTEQVLHPSKFFQAEEPREVAAPYAPPGGRLLNEGVLGELFTRTLLGDGSEAAAAGWGGDRFQVWDLDGTTLLVWRAVWDSGGDEEEFFEAAGSSLGRKWGAPGERGQARLFRAGAWTLALGRDSSGTWLVSSDAPAALDAALAALQRP